MILLKHFLFTTIVLVLFISVCKINGQENDDNNNNYDDGFDVTDRVPDSIQDLFQQEFDLSFLTGGNDTFNIQSLLAQYADLVPILQEYFADEIKFFDFQTRLNNISTPCMNKTVEFIQALGSANDWALRVMDAWGKPPSGILNYGGNWVGEYSECLDIKKLTKTWSSKYCAVQNGGIKYGICISNSCNYDDIRQLLNFGLSFLQPILKGTPVDGTFGEVQNSFIDCKEEKTYYASTIVTLIIVSALLFVVLFASLVDVVFTYLDKRNADENEEDKNRKEIKRPLFFEVLLSFSVLKNAPKVFHITHNSVDQFNCLHGMRVLSITWVILGHTYLQSLSVANNAIIFGDWLKEFWFSAVINGTFSVDTFFVISGFLLAYLFLRETSKMTPTISVPFMMKYYFHRIWRLTPLFMIVTILSAFASRHWGTGPFFPKDGFETNMCEKTWWTNLLYINNFNNYIYDKNTDICLGHSWYLSNDMQFHWFAPLMLIPFALNKRIIGWTISGLLIIMHILCVSLIINANPGFEIAFGNEAIAAQTFQTIYVKPWCRVGTFVIGILLGHYLFELKKKDKVPKIDYRINIIAWILAIGMCFLMVFGLYPDLEGVNPLSRTARIMYQTFSRLMWGLGIAYMIFACVTSNGGVINRFLSHPFWIPLSRISYAVYLIHFAVLKFFILRLDHPLYLRHDTLYLVFFGSWLVSFILSFFFSIFFESPFINLEKFILPRRKKD